MKHLTEQQPPFRACQDKRCRGTKQVCAHSGREFTLPAAMWLLSRRWEGPATGLRPWGLWKGPKMPGFVLDEMFSESKGNLWLWLVSNYIEGRLWWGWKSDGKGSAGSRPAQKGVSIVGVAQWLGLSLDYTVKWPFCLFAFSFPCDLTVTLTDISVLWDYAQ